MAVTKERALERLVALEKNCVHTWAMAQQRCDRLTINDL
jgi:hypothetical protein